jgi:cytochrome P450
MPVLGWRGNSIIFLRDPMRYLQRSYETYGPLSGLVRDDPRSVFAIGPEYNHQLLSDSRLFYTIFETITPERLKRRRRSIGILNMNGEQHKQQRRLMQPAFHRKQIEGYRDDMVAITRAALDTWRPGQTLDIAQALQQLTLRVAGKTLFGLDLSREARGFGVLIKQLLDTPFFTPSISLLPIDLPGTPFRRMMEQSRRLDDAILALIARKRADTSSQRDVLATLIAARDEEGGSMTDMELLGQTTTLLIAGHETSSNALAWTLFLLAQHPHVLADLVDELDGALRGAAPTVEQIKELPLLERVIKESMRLLPPAALGSRVSTAPFELGPYEMPKGAIVTFSQYLTHRLPELYPEPLKFRPERWERIDPSPYEYLPFGAGPRMCIGASFAMMEIKLVLAMLLQRYRLQVVPGANVDWQVKITLAPSNGMPMTVSAQDRQYTKTEVRGTIHEAVDLT